MGTKRMPGLTFRKGIWHIDKKVKDYGRLCESTGCSSIEAANQFLADRLAEIRQAQLSGRPRVTWREAATKYLLENQGKASIADDARHLKALDSFIGDSLLEHIHDDTLRPFVEDRRTAGLRTNSINRALAVVRRVLNLSARSWRHPSGKTWLETAPLITMQKPPQGRSDGRKPYPLDWDEQEKLIKAQHPKLARMTLYAVNTGCREAEICGLRWKWEWKTDVKELQGRVFIIPGDADLVNGTGVKNRQDKLVVLNDIAHSVVESCRGEHPEFVFTNQLGNPVKKMHTTAWKFSWIRAGLPDDGVYLKGVHNLRHTCGQRLRAAGVSNETRKTILGHKNGDITSHYSEAGILELLEAVNRLCHVSRKSPALTLVKLSAGES
ncbi:MAG: integrase [Gammaproteobacteria bacterium]|nr:integrase [Gammaproteobacteria bacterium]MBJ54706.1 integrase [Gammaproteobacteria bacterium]|tara:strand:+ start:805 stop:1947 length:1143 start_codon:yes stop_codon:yes gene_type:complete